MTNHLENERNIQTNILILIDDHKKILAELSIVEKSITDDPTHLKPDMIEVLRELKDFTLFTHHKREDDVLFTWMLEQNPNADKMVIKRIRDEHERLETLQRIIFSQIAYLSSDESVIPPKTLVFTVTEFIQLYREHIDVEEKFIYPIAKGLILARQQHRN